MLATNMFFWDWSGAPVPEVPPFIDPGAGSGGKGKGKGKQRPPYTQFSPDYWQQRERRMLKSFDIENEEDMRKNKELEAENADFTKKIEDLLLQVMNLSSTVTTLQQENAMLTTQHDAMQAQLNDPAVQAAVMGDWDGVREQLTNREANTTEELHSVIRALGKNHG